MVRECDQRRKFCSDDDHLRMVDKSSRSCRNGPDQAIPEVRDRMRMQIIQPVSSSISVI